MREIKIINSNYFYIIILTVLNIFSIVPYLSYFCLLLEIALFVYFTVDNNKLGLALIVFSTSTYSRGLSIYSYKIIYLLMIIYLLLNYRKLLFRKTNLIFVMYLLYIVVISIIFNMYSKMSAFMNDAIVLSGILIGFFMFENITVLEINTVSITLFISNILLNLFCYFTKFGYSDTTDFLGRRQLLISFSETMPLFMILNLYFLFFMKEKRMFRIFIVITWFFVTIKTAAYGSMVMIFLIISLCYVSFLRFKKSLGFIIPVMIFVLFISMNFVGLNGKDKKENDSTFLYKMKNITELFENFSFTDYNKLQLVPLSPYVRVLELINTTKTGNAYTIINGKGLGGSFKDTYFPFENKYRKLGPDDFALEQRQSHVFLTAHNIGYPYLKYGLVYFFFIFAFIIFKRNKLLKQTNYLKYYTFVLVLASTCFFGFTFQTSLVIGLFFSGYKSINNLSELELKKEINYA